MQEHKNIALALASARFELQPEERILIIGKSILAADMLYTKVAIIAFFAVIAIICIGVVLIRFTVFVVLSGFVIVVGILLLVFFFFCLFLAPLMDLYRRLNAPLSQEICIITTQRVLSIKLNSSIINEEARRSDIDKILTEKNRVTLTMSDGSKKQIKVIEGLNLEQYLRTPYT